jgi:hypothetical protein
MAQGLGLDTVDELVRLALSGDHIKPSPGQKFVRGKSKNAPGKGVQTPEVVQEPTIQLLGANRGLDLG